MYIVNLKQEARLRKFVIEKELATQEELSLMTDDKVLELILEFYVPIVIEPPKTQNEKYVRDFYLIGKESFKDYTTKIEA